MAGLLNNPIITEKSVRDIYKLLKSLPPFNTWKLPSDKQIVFKVIEKYNCMGEMHMKPFKMVIGANHHDHFETLVTTIAHEMVHLKLYIDKDKSYRRHGVAFRALTAEIGSIFGFDRKTL